MKTVILLAAVAAANLGFGAADPLAGASLRVRTNKNPVTYGCNEPMTFTFYAAGARSDWKTGDYLLDWTIISDDNGFKTNGVTPFASGIEGTDVRAVVKRPGFAIVTAKVVSAKDPKRTLLSAKAAAGANVGQLKPVNPAPKDFDAFWVERKARLAAVPFDAENIRLTPVEIRQKGVREFFFEIPCAGPRPATGMLSIPEDAFVKWWNPLTWFGAKKYPIRIDYCGYGINGYGKVDGSLAVDKIWLVVNAHGFKMDGDKEYYKQFGVSVKSKSNGKDYDYGFDPEINRDADSSYFMGMFYRALRSAEFAKTLPQWDGEHLQICGGSQGGWQTLWVAAHVPGVTYAEPVVPWGCDQGAKEAGRMGALSIEYTPSMSYFDAVHHAARIPADVAVNFARVGLIDGCCRPAGIACAYNAVRSPNKGITWYQCGDHGPGPEWLEKFPQGAFALSRNLLVSPFGGKLATEAAKDAKGSVTTSVSKVEFVAPKEWKGKFVRFEIPPAMMAADAVLTLNGRRIGDIYRPYGWLDVTDAIRPGETNRYELFLTRSGEGTAEGKSLGGKWVHFGTPFPSVPPRFVAGEDAVLDDVFANTSYRRKKVTFETLVLARADIDGEWEMRIDVEDAAGRVVKKLVESVKLAGGENRLTFEVPWEDPHLWEYGDGYLYTCRARIVKKPDTNWQHRHEDRRDFTFGFREIWREGRRLMMNGHELHLRTCYSFGAQGSLWGCRFMRDIGYNVLSINHMMNQFPAGGVADNDPTFYWPDRLGMGLFCSPGDMAVAAGMDTMTDKKAEAFMLRYWEKCHRRLRNYPSVTAFYITQMQICDINFDPMRLGRFPSEIGRYAWINSMVDIGHRFNPNVLFYSHADGSCGEIASGNMYLNWTPLQEREEWLSVWSKEGVLPWHGAEFGQPYGGCWWTGHLWLAPEHHAQFFGDRAFEVESDELLKTVSDAGAYGGGHGTHHGWNYLWKYPLYWDLERLFVRRTNPSWRAYGLNGGNNWFNLIDAYGRPDGSNGAAYGKLSRADYERKDEWVNPAFKIYQQGNLPYCAFLGGVPEHPDKTHAYYAGETIAKQVVLIWDGVGERTASVRVKVEKRGGEGKAVFAKTFDVELKPGETKFVPVSFVAPQVAQKTAYTISCDFGDGQTDTFDFEVYPKASTNYHLPSTNYQLFLYDPKGLTAPVLDALGIAYTKLDDLSQLSTRNSQLSTSHLIIGRFALTGAALPVTPEMLKGGLKVLVLAQTAKEWQALGLKPMDTVSRQLWLRDRGNAAFAELTDDTLANWRGAPVYNAEKNYGPLMAHPTQRGPRWTYNHAIAGLTLQIPQRAGFTSLIDGECGMNYVALLRFSAGEGSVTCCTLDFTDRVPSDPAATTVAKGVFGEFLAQKPTPTKAMAALGADAAKLAERLGFATDAKATDFVLAGGDAQESWTNLAERAKAGATVVVAANARLAKEAGFTVAETARVLRGKLPTSVARGQGPAVWRWPDGVDAVRLEKAPAGFAIEADGLVASGTVGAGKVVFCQVPGNAFARLRYANPTNKVDYHVQQAERDDETVSRLWAGVLTNLGAEPSATTVARALYQSPGNLETPLPAAHVLGPFNTQKDDGRWMLDGKWGVSGEHDAEAMCIAGDFNPNFEFEKPQGGTCNWRPLVSPDVGGRYDLTAAFPDGSLSVSYLIINVNRKEAGKAVLRTGCDWRERIWVNGEKVFETDFGTQHAPYKVEVDLRKGDNVISVKTGSGRSASNVTLLLTRELDETDKARHPNAALDKVGFYDDLRPANDPYQFVYW